MEHPVSLCFGTLAGEGGNKEGVATKLESEGLEGGKKYKSRQGGLMEGRQKVRSTKKGDERTPEAKITSSVFFGVSLSFFTNQGNSKLPVPTASTLVQETETTRPINHTQSEEREEEK